MKKVCILNVATNHYIKFINPLLDSIDANFLNGHTVDALVFTNQELEVESDRIKVSQIQHEPWPMPTLKRYHYFLQEKEHIQKYDYCFYLDVDMLIADKVGEEIFGDLVATQHPGMWAGTPDYFTYERRPQSTAYVPYGTGSKYYAGGFNGGKPENFLGMAETIVENINRDFDNGIIAEWHDESHMNRYLIDNPPTLELNPSYCFPEGADENGAPTKYYPYGWKVPFPPKIMALQKNHNEVRK
jgi:histo-blood group ABO system transferase